MDKVNNEVWKTYSEFSFVEVSTFGRVRTLDRVVPSGLGLTRLIKGHVLKQQDNGHGYLFVGFNMNGKTVTRYVHRLVAQTFIPNPDNLAEINHKDNNPTNNCVINLEWCTHEYNMQYKEKYGKSATEAVGHPAFAINLKTSEVLCFQSQSEASRVLGIHVGNINSVIKGRYKTAKGYWFTNANSNAVEATRNRFDDVVAYKVEKLMDIREGKVEQQWLNDFINEMQPA